MKYQKNERHKKKERRQGEKKDNMKAKFLILLTWAGFILVYNYAILNYAYILPFFFLLYIL